MSINLERFNQDLLLEINLMEKFLEVVIYEQSVLASTDIDKLENILQIKADLINELLLVSNNRLSNLAGLGFPEKNSSMTLLIRQSTNVSLEQQWQKLINIGSQADEINKNNGYIVNGLFFSNQKSLAFLQGKSINSLYGPDGRS
jgi:flagellar biosynthesis/type III secretory pathway chaperone